MNRRTLALLGGPVAAATTWIVLYFGTELTPGACWTAGITTLCAIWWIFEPIHMTATSIIPFAAFPMAGVLTHKEVAQSYGHTLILLLLGGSILATAMERSGAHRRVALGMVRLVGGSGGRRLVLGFMLAAALLSMWVSNTATTLMLLPVAIAVLEQVEEKQLTVPLLLGIAFGANIGGIGTPIGTPPNVIFMAKYDDYVADPQYSEFVTEHGSQAYSFLGWMKIAMPIVVVFLPLAWLWLTRRIRGTSRIALPGLGPWRTQEIRVLVVFAITALAWMTRTEPFGGWAGLIGCSGKDPTVGDSTVALLMVVVMFLVPDGKGGFLLQWDKETVSTVPWGLLLLIGAGLAISQAFKASGLTEELEAALSGLKEWHVIAMIAVICLSITFVTEVLNNTSTTALMLPILLPAAVAFKLDPALLMVPAAISASCAFMLPVATAPNAIVFGTNRFPTRTMVREGFALNLIGAVVITATCYLLLGGK